MKIIDFEKKGNVVRFYLGADDCNDYWGDDWADVPYEHNAGSVYPEYISGVVDLLLPYSASVIEAKDDWHYNGNTPFCKEDMKNRNVPCIIIVPKDITKNFWGEPEFSLMSASDNVYKVYFNDPFESLINVVTSFGATLGEIIYLHYDSENRKSYDKQGKEFDPYYD